MISSRNPRCATFFNCSSSRAVSVSSRACALVTGISSTISITLTEVSSISLRKSRFLALMLFLNKFRISTATGIVARKNQNTVSEDPSTTPNDTTIFRIMLSTEIKICEESVSICSTSRIILDCKRPDCISL